MKEPYGAGLISAVVEQLVTTGNECLCCNDEMEQMPSGKELFDIVELVRAIIFPGYYGDTICNVSTLHYRLGVNIEKLHYKLSSQVYAALCFCHDKHITEERKRLAEECTVAFIAFLPELRSKLDMDVKATYNGDPAAKSFAEVICCYPTIKAVLNYRMAHKLYELGVPLLPRMITEMAHSETGIDIHPGAIIGDNFSIDHGTGIVIGETCIIGNNVKLYQGVTLGARSFPVDDSGNPIKGILRHPIIGNNVVIYSNATVLGRVTIGDNAVIGGNVWITENVPEGMQVIQKR